MKSPAASFAEIRAVAASLPASDFVWPPAFAHPRIVLYAATHGIAVGLPGGSSQDMTELVEDIVAGPAWRGVPAASASATSRRSAVTYLSPALSAICWALSNTRAASGDSCGCPAPEPSTRG